MKLRKGNKFTFMKIPLVWFNHENLVAFEIYFIYHPEKIKHYCNDTERNIFDIL